jgi:phosphatidate cytidylyltransferase
MTHTPEPAPKAQSDLTVRFAAGVAMIAVAVLVTIFGGWAFRIFASVAAAAMLVEWAGLRKVPALWAWVGAALAAGLLLGGAEYFYPVAYDPDTSPYLVDLTWLSFAPVLGGAVLIGLASRRPAMGWGFLYIVLPSLCLVVLSWLSASETGALVFWALIVTWATDIFAYFAGRAIGGPKLAPRISPNKTWAGLIGGMVGASYCGWAVAWYFELGTPFVWIGAIMGLLAQLGDLYESWEKRRAGIKDSSNLLPGHGGVLDRLDGLLAVAVAVMLIILLNLWHPPETDDASPPADMMTVQQLTGSQAG